MDELKFESLPPVASVPTPGPSEPQSAGIQERDLIPILGPMMLPSELGVDAEIRNGGHGQTTAVLPKHASIFSNLFFQPSSSRIRLYTVILF
jgi:hypothetical protein